MTGKPDPDPEFKVIMRHGTGALAFQDSGNDLEALLAKCEAERARAATRLSPGQAQRMTIATYERTS